MYSDFAIWNVGFLFVRNILPTTAIFNSILFYIISIDYKPIFDDSEYAFRQFPHAKTKSSENMICFNNAHA